MSTRILAVHVGFGPGAGGAGERNYQMCRHLLAAGDDVRMVISDKYLVDGRLPASYAFPRERVEILPLMNRRFEIPWPARRTIDRAVAQADVVHVTGHLGALAAAATASARRLKKPWVVCTAGGLSLQGRSPLLKRVFQRTVGRRILEDASHLIAVTAAERDEIGRFGPVTVIPNAIEPGALKSTPGTPPFILYLGGFHPSKGPDLLVEAFARVVRTWDAEVRLVMAGGYPALQSAVEARARALGIGDRVTFSGLLDADATRLALSRCAFLAIPSRHDAMTIVVLEAAAAGKPVLMTSACGFGDVEAVGGGFVVEASVEALARGLGRMMDARDRWPAMGRAMESLVPRYSWDAVTPLYRALFREVARA